MAVRKRAVLELAHPNAAGLISVRRVTMWRCLRTRTTSRCGNSSTDDLERLADWLVACGIDTVAMESTGIYWIPLFELLESRGFTVYLVNARHVRMSRAANPTCSTANGCNN